MNNPTRLILRTVAVAGLLIASGLFPKPGYGQLNAGGTPLTSRSDVTVQNIPVVTVSPPDLAALQLRDAQEPLPYRFAVNIPVQADFPEEGAWTTLADGSRVCLLAVEAPGAKAVSLLFDRFRLPDNGRLFIYSADRKQVLGAYTSINNDASGRFSAQLIHAGRVILEYDAPASSPLPEIRLCDVVYAYRGVPDEDEAKGFGQAGPCEVNINCEEGQAYQQVKKGIVRVQAYKNSSAYWCTGSLVNNTRRDGSPYLLTADHCYKGGTPADLLNWVFYFDYETTGCENPTLPPQERALTGATFKARAGDVSAGGSDFLLLLLNDAIPDTFDVFLNGWSRINTQPLYGAGIHHPQGDIKKISTYTEKGTSTSWTGGSIYTHWLITWAETLNGHGVTEGGSSGSPVFNSEKLIVGTLTGGGSACDSASLTEPDYYGKFSYSWLSNGSDSASRLQPWLDPDSTGVETLEGKPVSVKEIASAGGVTVYPNPAGEVLFVKRDAAAGKGLSTMSLYDSRGILVRTAAGPEPGMTAALDLSGCPPGLYLVVLSTDRGNVTKKIVKYGWKR